MMSALKGSYNLVSVTFPFYARIEVVSKTKELSHDRVMDLLDSIF